MKILPSLHHLPIFQKVLRVDPEYRADDAVCACVVFFLGEGVRALDKCTHQHTHTDAHTGEHTNTDIMFLHVLQYAVCVYELRVCMNMVYELEA
jgi:hypothetical protein